LAAYKGHIAIVSYLYENGADVNIQNRLKADIVSKLIDAAKNGDLESVRNLVTQGANVNAKNNVRNYLFIIDFILL
jgi:ankyrin repeat protein